MNQQNPHLAHIDTHRATPMGEADIESRHKRQKAECLNCDGSCNDNQGHGRLVECGNGISNGGGLLGCLLLAVVLVVVCLAIAGVAA